MMPDPDEARLVEVAFALKQALLDRGREENVRLGHFGPVHIGSPRNVLALGRFGVMLPAPDATSAVLGRDNEPQ
jgi:hypothetical protein